MNRPFGTSIVTHFSVLLLRFACGFALIYYQGWLQAGRGWNFIWHNHPWPLVDQFSEGNPAPLAVFYAIMTAVFFFLSPAMLMLGFLTRLSAVLIFIGLVMSLGADLNLSKSLHTQTMVLYLALMIFFVLNGGGQFAADRLFLRRKGREHGSTRYA